MYKLRNSVDRLLGRRGDVASRGLAMLLAGTVAACAMAPEALAGPKEEEPFKLARVYFETNGSACDMGIQILFDTEGIKTAKFIYPNGRVIHEVRAREGMLDIGGQTEGFLEVVEPVIEELVCGSEVYGEEGHCDPDEEDWADAITMDDILEMFPPGEYDF